MALPAPRRFGAVNWRGLRTLVWRGVWRYFKMAWHTLGGPCISSLLLLAVFVLAAGGAGQMVPGIALAEFLVPGIVMFQLAHAAFENAAFPVLDDKLEGMIGDILAAPLSPLEILAGYVLPAVASGLMTGMAILGLGWLFADLRLHDLGALVGFALAAALLFALLGTFIGLWADRWEHYAMAENFVILPLGFLSGTFFTLSSLPEAARPLIALNPVFHAVGGVRYALTGYAETALLPGALLLGGPILLLWLLLWRLFATGYKIKP
ncbi:MAG: ABC transporter permease [Rhodospirillales bacterium]|nr:ABC transporter permease [Rhodospirillales bacterium]MDH3791931.1 ABC transporter permease [Rhodospirillales bacterium]MDH3911056.1 ABC transporter permease [Rhodospirillales bacterium]MDH3968788.1 ABC transporter permease [Rhodospirillales bacterium]